MITSDDLRNIVNTVIEQLRGETKTINDLPIADKANSTNYIELDNGKRCSLGAIINELVADWVGTQTEYNALPSHNEDSWYIIVDSIDGHTVALYRGERLITAEPNMVGEFAADSMPADWFWWPNGIKTYLPVDPGTLRFSFYWPGELDSASKLFTGAEKDYAKLKRLERIPELSSKGGSMHDMLKGLQACEVIPELDFRNRTEIAYTGLLNSRPVAFSRIAFSNTERVRKITQAININNLGTAPLKALTGIDFSSCESIVSFISAFENRGPSFVSLTNIGKAPGAADFKFINRNWGDDNIFPGSRDSLVDSLLTDSFDRAAAGYSALSVTLHADSIARLSEAEISAITAKGFTLISYQ